MPQTGNSIFLGSGSNSQNKYLPTSRPDRVMKSHLLNLTNSLGPDRTVERVKVSQIK